MSDLWTWANANSGGLALVGVLLSAMVLAIGYLAKHFRGIPIEIMLRDPASWSTLAQTYQSSSSDAYFQSLERILGLADRWYGERILSWRAYGKCLTLAIIYPLLALLIGWALFNIWNPAELELFRNSDDGLVRAARAALLASGLSAAYYIVKFVEPVLDFFSFHLRSRAYDDFASQTVFRSKLVRRLALYIAAFIVLFFTAAAAVAFALCGVFAVVGPVSHANVGLGFAVFGLASVGMAVFAANGIGGTVLIFSASIASMLALTGAGLNNDTALLLLLYFLIPLPNAAADLLSLAITRYFLAKVLYQKPALWMIIAQILLDLALAVCCLLLLLAALIGALEVWSAFSPSTAPLDWRVFWASIHAEPKQGISLYMMAATTLVPTVAHLIAGLGAVWTQKSRLLRPVAATLAAQPVSTLFPEVKIDRMLRVIGRATLWGYLSASVIVILPATLLLWAVYSLAL